jgi:hypothetical protein
MALLCMATGDDDDGNAAVERGPAPPKKAAPSVQDRAGVLSKARDAAKQGMDEFRTFYKSLSSSDRELVQGDFLEEMKDVAAAADAKGDA